MKVAAVYVLLDEEGSPLREGLVMAGGLGVPTPVICTDLDQPASSVDERLEAIRRFARKLARAYGKRLRLVKFGGREDVEVFDGQ